jgi:hypothetical protein
MSVTLWTKFYWSNWLGDAKLRSCSIGARGLWIDMLAVAAQSEPVGYIDSQTDIITQMSRVSGISKREVERLMGELEVAGVVQCDLRGRIFCPRMVRDNENLQKAISSGRRGGRKSYDLRRGAFKPSEGPLG